MLVKMYGSVDWSLPSRLSLVIKSIKSGERFEAASLDIRESYKAAEATSQRLIGRLRQG